MNLSLSKNNPRNTVLILPDGRAMYHINTPNKLFRSVTTTIRRVDTARSNNDNGDGVGRIEWRSFSNTELWMGERMIQPYKNGTFRSSKIFRAADGRDYKWKIAGGYLLLVMEGGSDTPIVTFHKAKGGFFSTPRLAFLEITPQGVHILDDIVTTFVWFEDQRREAPRVGVGITYGPPPVTPPPAALGPCLVWINCTGTNRSRKSRHVKSRFSPNLEVLHGRCLHLEFLSWARAVPSHCERITHWIPPSRLPS